MVCTIRDPVQRASALLAWLMTTRPSVRCRHSRSLDHAGRHPRGLARYFTAVIVVIKCTDLPGIRCGPRPEGGWYENVHVGLCVRGANQPGMTVVPARPWSVGDLVPGDADQANWEFDGLRR